MNEYLPPALGAATILITFLLGRHFGYCAGERRGYLRGLSRVDQMLRNFSRNIHQQHISKQ